MGMGNGKSKSATTRHCPLIPLLNVNKNLVSKPTSLLC